jgi:hypothetical protein
MFVRIQDWCQCHWLKVVLSCHLFSPAWSPLCSSVPPGRFTVSPCLYLCYHQAVTYKSTVPSSASLCHPACICATTRPSHTSAVPSSASLCHPACIFFSPLIVFGGTEVYCLYFSSAAPQRTAYSEVPSQMATHLRTAVHCGLGRLLDSNPELQFYNLVSLPMSHHCSHPACICAATLCSGGAHL